MLLNAAPKFGNDDPEADDMAVRVLNLYWDEIAKYPSGRGGVYTGRDYQSLRVSYCKLCKVSILRNLTFPLHHDILKKSALRRPQSILTRITKKSS